MADLYWLVCIEDTWVNELRTGSHFQDLCHLTGNKAFVFNTVMS